MDKSSIRRSIVIIVILLLSLLAGYLYNTIGNKIDMKNHPIMYEEQVEKYSAEYGIPKYVIYALINASSGFDSEYTSGDARIGLMQIPFEYIGKLSAINGENIDRDTLYEPDANIKYGTYIISRLYGKYNSWQTVFAAYKAGEEAVDAWLTDERYAKDGVLVQIPDDAAVQFVSAAEKQAEAYKKLYY